MDWERITQIAEELECMYGTCNRFPHGITRHYHEWCGEWTEENVRERFDYD